MTRLRFRLAEMIAGPVALTIVDGLLHVAEGKPFMSDYLFGAVVAVFFLRGIDALRAAARQWPET